MPPPQIMELAETADEPYARLLRLLRSLREAKETNVKAFREQHQGATYRQLAYIGHLVGMNKAQRVVSGVRIHIVTANFREHLPSRQ
jgi:ABC-type transport system involved in cytochrome c biogenesis ATPase subunit